ncbi:Protein of unknown function (DUF3311) [Frankia torreyi]|uniref:DUF3311 domain-containing protein n=1 Tax=Frankia torreyi TaxID=1856 RepID=A0A0D8BH06_9ACTN|nr:MULTISPECIES: DUF3311 domain-containing protein [Frankia]KJE23431.1 Protein of unknown function (DUF3311) [Frankia torreyi]KQM05567.1 Protein of unknown function (DUF3311) [Frankia sp. CpI1-P]
MTHARGAADPGGRPRRSRAARRPQAARRSGQPPARADREPAPGGAIGVGGTNRAGGLVARTVAAAVLAVQVVALLLVGTYARRGPRLWGFPFFYWYTLLWLLLGATGMAGCTWLLGRATRPPAAAGAQANQANQARRDAAGGREDR